MEIQDKLSHDERLRVDCLAQALRIILPEETNQTMVDRAALFEDYVRNGKKSLASKRAAARKARS